VKELLRTTDPVRLSWLTALLAEQGVHAVVFDTHTSILEGSIGAIPRRILVGDDDYEAARRLLVAAGELDAPEGSSGGGTLLGGRVVLDQPEGGYRAAIDPVLLAAAVPAVAGRVLDAGAGVGAAALCYAARVPGARVTGLELQDGLAAMATENARRNGVGDRVTILCGDILRPPAELGNGGFDHVMANPPYLPANHGPVPPDPSKATAMVEGEADLEAWLGFCLRMVAPRGSITLVHRADRLADILGILNGRAGGIVVFPLWPGEGRDAKRVIVQARRDGRAPLRLAPGLVLHRAGGAYTDAALAVLRDGAALDL
jgi:tRNA1(Val) A37 N6-methylase TrmN6